VAFPQRSPTSHSGTASCAVPPLCTLQTLRASLFPRERSSETLHTPPSDGSSTQAPKCFEAVSYGAIAPHPPVPLRAAERGTAAGTARVLSALWLTHLRATLLSLGWTYDAQKLFNASPFSRSPAYSSKSSFSLLV